MKANTTVRKLAIFNSIIKMLLLSLSFFMGVFLKSIGLSGAEIGMVFAISMLASIITILPSGFTNDRIKSRTLITIALLFIASHYFGVSFIRQFPALVIIFLIGGIGSTIYSTSIDSFFYKSSGGKDNHKNIGTFLTLNFLLEGLGIALAGYLLEMNISFEIMFMVVSAAFLFMAVISHFILPSTITAKFELIEYKADFFRPKVTFFLIIMFLFSIHFGAENTTYGLFVKETLGLSPFHMGLYMGSAICSMALTIWVISKRFQKMKPRNLLLIGLFLSGVFHILMTVRNPVYSAIFRTIHEVGDASMFFFIYYGVSKMFDKKRVGGNTGIVTFTTAIGASLGAMISGPMGEHFGYDKPLIFTGITTLIALFLALQFIHHFDHES